jgi:hypothetical protein
MYKVIKRNSDGKVYDTVIESDAKLIEHLKGMFVATNHELIAVIKI